MAKGIIGKSILNAAAGMTMLVTGFASSVITARLLGPEANGTVAFAFWLTTTGTLIAGLGSDVILARMLPQLTAEGFDERQRRGFAAFVAQFVLIAILTTLAVLVVINSQTDSIASMLGPRTIILLTGLLFFLQAIGTMSVNVLIGEQRPLVFFRLTIISSILQLVVTIVGALYYGVAGALSGYLASYLVFFVYALRLLAVKPQRCGIGFGILIKASLYISLGTIIESIFLNRIELAFLQHFQGVHAVGFYAIAITLANLALQLPVQLSGTLVPYYTELAHKQGSTKLPVHLFEDVIRILAYMALPMGLGLAAISWEVVTDIFGDDFAGAGTIVALLALSAPLSVFSQISTKYLFAIGQEQPRLIIGVIGALTITVGCLLIVPVYGAEGAAVARIIMLAVISGLMVARMDFEGSLAGMFASLAKLGLASLVCAVDAYFVSRLVDGLLGTALGIITGAALYLVCLRLFHAVPAKDTDALRILSDRLPRKAGILIKGVAAFMSGKPNGGI